jgi:hypothetical protein
MNFFSQKKFVLLREVKIGKFSTKEQKRAKKSKFGLFSARLLCLFRSFVLQ